MKALTASTGVRVWDRHFNLLGTGSVTESPNVVQIDEKLWQKLQADFLAGHNCHVTVDSSEGRSHGPILHIEAKLVAGETIRFATFLP